jgi:Na+-driven multidrug efflux pump
MRTSDDRSVLETGDARDVWEWINRWSRLAIYLRQVIPNFVAVFIENFTYFLMTSFAIQLGDKPIVAHNINMLLLGVLSTITYGMCEATSIRIGYHIGRRDVEAAKTVILIATVGSAVVSWTIAAVMVLFATELTSLFTDDSDISRLSVSIAPIVWSAYALFCTGSQLLAVLKGQGRAREQARLLLVR